MNFKAFYESVNYLLLILNCYMNKQTLLVYRGKVYIQIKDTNIRNGQFLNK